jgi:HK97 family phage portal protein
MAGFLQTPTQPAPDAGPLLETDQISAVVSRCINVISEDAAHVPLQLYDMRGAQPTVVTDHPAIALWRHINPVETPTVYKQQLYADLLAEGNHFAWVALEDGVPQQMIRLAPEEVTVIPDDRKGGNSTIIKGYEWRTSDSKVETYGLNQILHFRTRNPASIYRGMGLLARAREQIIMDRSLRQYKIAQVRNGIPTSMVVTMKNYTGGADDAAFERFTNETWAKQRGVANAGKPWFIREGDVDIDLIPRATEDETALLATLTYTRNEFAMLFGVPPSRLSDYGSSFRANASEQSRSYWQDTIMTWHRLVIDYLNSIFLPRYFPEEISAAGTLNIKFGYEYSQVRALALSHRDMASVNEILVRNAMRTPNEAAISMGDPIHDDPAADELYMNGKKLGSKEEPEEQPESGDQPGDITEPDIGDEGQTPEEEQDDEERAALHVIDESWEKRMGRG